MGARGGACGRSGGLQSEALPLWAWPHRAPLPAGWDDWKAGPQTKTKPTTGKIYGKFSPNRRQTD